MSTSEIHDGDEKDGKHVDRNWMKNAGLICPNIMPNIFVPWSGLGEHVCSSFGSWSLKFGSSYEECLFDVKFFILISF